MKDEFSKLELNDFDLMERIKRSDEDAFHILYKRYWKLMYAFAFSLIEKEEICKGIVQEVWINIWERRKKIKNDFIKAYLFKAVRFRVYKELRDNKNLNSHLEIIDNIISSNNVEDNLNLSDTLKLIQDSVSKLPRRNREIFEMSRYDRLSNQEIADKKGISKHTVENHITTSLKIIRRNVVITLLFSISGF